MVGGFKVRFGYIQRSLHFKNYPNGTVETDGEGDNVSESSCRFGLLRAWHYSPHAGLPQIAFLGSLY